MTYYATANRREPHSRFEMPEKYKGYGVFDPESRKVGSVKELYTNTYGDPEYVRVRMGIFGLKTVLIPVGFVAIDEERQTLTLQ